VPDEPQLKRSLGLLTVTWYGVGTIVGGGFYALAGKVAGEAGYAAPFSYLLAAAIAGLSAVSFAELSSRHPYSAGESRYVQEGFGRASWSAAVGWMVIATGVVSAATLARAFAGFSQTFVDFSEPAIIVVAVLALGLIAGIGIGESAAAVGLITAAEVGGLLWILAAQGDALAEVPARAGELVPAFTTQAWSGVFAGAYLCFYSFIGFEDMVNVAEEVRRPRRNLPRAIFLSLGITTLLYLLVVTVAVLQAPLDELAAAEAPLSLLLEGEGRRDALTVIAMFAGLNGALVQVVMATRVAYGMAQGGWGPSVFGRVHPKTRTPLEATAAATAVILVLALWFPLTALAEVTSTILLAVFALVNLALLRIKRRGDPAPEAVRFPIGWPAAGFLACVAFLAYRLTRLL